MIFAVVRALPALILLWLSIGVAAPAPQAKPATTKTQLALNWKPEPQFGGFYAAEELGAFAKRGLAVELLPGGAGTPVVQMVAAGRAEFGIASGEEVVISRARGTDVVALFAVYQSTPYALMARPERGAKSIAELFAGDSPIAMQKGLPYAMFLLKKYPQVKARILPYLGGIGNLAADPKFAQQCFVTSEPLLAKKQGLNVQVFRVSDEGFNPYTTVLIAREATLKAKPEIAKAMVEAVREGWASYLASPAVANAKMQKLNPSMDAETFKASAEAQRPLIETPEIKAAGASALGKMTERRWSELSGQLLDLKVIDKAPVAGALFRDM